MDVIRICLNTFEFSFVGLCLFTDDSIQNADVSLVARIKGFVCEQQNTILQMIVKMPHKVIGLKNLHAMLTKDLCNGACRHPFASSLQSTKNYCHLTVLAWTLDRPRHPIHLIFKMLLNIIAKDLADIKFSINSQEPGRGLKRNPVHKLNISLRNFLRWVEDNTTEIL